jgi:carbon storage regulator CsrA
MLTLSRKEGESIILNTVDGEIRVAIKSIGSGGQVKLSISAPDSVAILREELVSSQDYQE